MSSAHCLRVGMTDINNLVKMFDDRKVGLTQLLHVLLLQETGDADAGLHCQEPHRVLQDESY